MAQGVGGGPRPKSTAVRKLEGDHHKSRYNMNEPRPVDSLDYEDIPESVRANEYALEMWEYIAPRLVFMGVAADVDRFGLESLCITYGLWRFRSTVQLTGRLQSQLAEFGLTPSSRTRLVGSLPHEKSDKLERLMKRP